ncbi:GspE/PulE family protein [Planctomicrobium sp. SH664]|uniref:GspE/PulE family protein n=1 Tax=Planctomicrobium sp. SH664 TaxID=3448125 RepID=UPI003F5AF9F9
MSVSIREEFDRLQQAIPAPLRNEPVQVVDRLLEFARSHRASDLHLIPENGGLELQCLLRIDGVLHPLTEIRHLPGNVVTRLKVLAHLLTYRTDIPQEGRIRTGEEQLEMRVSTFPTVHGEKGVVRLFVGSGSYRLLGDLGLPREVETTIQGILSDTSGLLIVCGPAGSGKTTTLYACLRHIQQQSPTRRSLCTLEDPIEALLPGTSQSQVKPDGEFTYQRGLASLLRQDPEVIMVGEIRDRETAQIVFQASLTGHLVLSSFHSATAADAIARLSDMQIEPYVLRSGLSALLAQRLMRRSCPCLQQGSQGCPECRHTGYRGRIVLAELLQPNLKGLGRAILNRDDSEQIEQLAISAGMIPLRQRGEIAVTNGQTTPAELVRVLGSAAQLPATDPQRALH